MLPQPTPPQPTPPQPTLPQPRSPVHCATAERRAPVPQTQPPSQRPPSSQDRYLPQNNRAEKCGVEWAIVCEEITKHVQVPRRGERVRARGRGGSACAVRVCESFSVCKDADLKFPTLESRHADPGTRISTRGSRHANPDARIPTRGSRLGPLAAPHRRCACLPDTRRPPSPQACVKCSPAAQSAQQWS